MTDDWVLDVTFWKDGEDQPLAFCPIADNGDILTGLTVIGSTPPGRMVAVFHADGQEQVEAWMDSHTDVLDRLWIDLQAAGKVASS